MKKILLLLAIGLLLAATASAQEWGARLTGTYQCNHDMKGHLTFSIGTSNHPDPAPICTSVGGTLDPYDPKPGYTLTPTYVTKNNLGNLAHPIYKCYNNFLTGVAAPTEWGYQFLSTEASCRGIGRLSMLSGMTTPEIVGYTLKQAAPGTKEVFLCENRKDCCTAHNMPWIYYFISTDPNCRSDKRPGSTKIASLGFWPQNTDYVYKTPTIPTTPEVRQEQAVPIGVKTLTNCYRTMTYKDGSKTRQINDYFTTVTDTCFDNGKKIASIGKTIDSKESDIVLLTQCKAPFKTQFNYMVSTDSKCEGQGIEGPLGYAYKTQKPGTIPLRRCRYTENNDHYTTIGKCEAAYDEGILGYINPMPSEICCMLTNKEGEKKANVMQETQCIEEAKKIGGKYTASSKEECDKEVCCTYEGKYDWTKFRNCYERKGTTVERTREQCRPICGNDLLEAGEQCEKNADCKTNYECKECRCTEVCTIKQADNDALLAQLSVLEKRNTELRSIKMCGISEKKEGDKIEFSACNNLGECVIEAKAKGMTLIKTYKEATCRAR